jgi:hypothetical protein
MPPSGRRSPGREVTWFDERVDLVVSNLELYRSALERAERRTRWTVKEDVRSTLTVLLPLVDLGYDFHLLTLTVPRPYWGTEEDAQRALDRALENLARRAAFRECTGFAFRHRGTRRRRRVDLLSYSDPDLPAHGQADLHVLLASPPGGLNHEKAKKIAKKLTKGFPECTYAYLNTDGRKRFWPTLNSTERREALEVLVLYLTRQFLSPRARDLFGKKRITRFRSHALPEHRGALPSVFPLSIEVRRGVYVFGTHARLDTAPSASEGTEPAPSYQRVEARRVNGPTPGARARPASASPDTSDTVGSGPPLRIDYGGS